MATGLDRAVSIALILATVAIAGSVVYRNIAPAATTSAPGTPGAEKPTLEASWTTAMRHGATILGDSTAPVTVLELTDLECPACRGFQARLEQLVERHPHVVRVVYLAYPLSIHRFALGAARAADCALDESPAALSRWVGVVYGGQDSLGLRSWGSYAAAANIADTAAIAACATNPAPRARVDSSMAWGQRIEVNGTPTILVNGWRFQGLPSDKALDDLIATLTRSSNPPATPTGQP